MYTGATLSIMSHCMYLAMWPNESVPPIESSNTKLSTYTGQQIGIVGAIDVDVHQGRLDVVYAHVTLIAFLMLHSKIVYM